jgi:hypothetical protein
MRGSINSCDEVSARRRGSRGDHLYFLREFGSFVGFVQYRVVGRTEQETKAIVFQF